MTLIAGVDEVGRGPLAGPVVAAAVILDPKHPIEGITDSKKLSEKKRVRLAEIIKNHAYAWALGRAEVDEIDAINILQASLLAMRRAVLALPVQPDRVLVDGKQVPDLPMPAQAVIQGDLSEPCIGAASIIAKVHRDAEMDALHARFPGYGWARNKGYPTKEHRQALIDLGLTEVHRRSFGPVKKVMLDNKAMLAQ